MTKINLKEQIFLKNLKNFHQVSALNLKALKELPQELFLRRLSVGAERPPHTALDYYERASSILLKILEHPMGVKKIGSLYGRMRRSKVKPPKRYPATRSLIKTYLDYLLSLDMISVHKKGFYTNKNGKEHLRLCLNRL